MVIMALNRDKLIRPSYFASPNTMADIPWYMDSGASNHVIANAHNLTTKVDYKGKVKQSQSYFNLGIHVITHINHIVKLRENIII